MNNELCVSCVIVLQVIGIWEILKHNPYFYMSINDMSIHCSSAEFDGSVDPKLDMPGEADITDTSASGACCQELEKIKQAYTYLSADVENIRRRAERDSVARVRASNISLLQDIVVLADDMTKLHEDIQHPALDMVLRKLDKFFQQRDIKEVPASGIFNPEQHQEAIAQIPASSPELVGTIAQVVQKGYTYQGTLLRPAQVVVYAEPIQ
jgi:molecular chaperone GrpE (heat shock protein)